jgi:CRISPR/Cas system CSM-associated protein Csm3 (group 7 of RAMP superfamily)
MADPTVRIELTVTTRTALSVGAGGSAGTLADKSIVRDGWERPIIPASQVKGKTRHAVEAVLHALNQPVQRDFDDDAADNPNLVRDIFGSPRVRSPLRFADLIGVIGSIEQIDALCSQPEQHQSQIRPSVAINRRRGTAAEARLLFQETALEETRFYAENAVAGTLPDIGHAALLWAALRLTTRWGGAKSRGLGWSKVTARVFWNGQEQDAAALSRALRTLALPARSS